MDPEKATESVESPLSADEARWFREQRDARGRAVTCDAEFRALLERHRCRPVVREVRDDGQVVQVQVGFVPLP